MRVTLLALLADQRPQEPHKSIYHDNTTKRAQNAHKLLFGSAVVRASNQFAAVPILSCAHGMMMIIIGEAAVASDDDPLIATPLMVDEKYASVLVISTAATAAWTTAKDEQQSDAKAMAVGSTETNDIAVMIQSVSAHWRSVCTT